MFLELRHKFNKLEKKVLNNEKFFETLLLWPFTTYVVIRLYDEIPDSAEKYSVYGKITTLLNTLIFKNLKDKNAAILMMLVTITTLIILVERVSVNTQSKLDSSPQGGKQIIHCFKSKLKKYRSLIYEFLCIYFTLTPTVKNSINSLSLIATTITTSFVFRKVMRFILIKVKKDENIESQNKVIRIISILSYGFLLVKLVN